MRLAGAALSMIVAVGFAAAQPAAKDAPAKAAPAKVEAKAKAKADTKAPKADKKAALDAITASYQAIPLAERLAIQNDLIWTGDYNGLVNGEFGERAVAAVKAFQKRNGGKETGVLNQPERATLAAAAKPKQDQVGWRMVDDPATGARIGVPGKLVPQQSQIVGGTRWASSRAEYSVETFRITQPGTTLAAVFERMKKEPAGRKPDYGMLKPDFFVISGLQNLKKFYVRAQLRGDEVRGFTVQYDQAMAGIMDPVVVAMSSAYAPFTSPAAPPPRRKVEYASGVAVAPGYIVTSREALDGCYVTTVAGVGGADRIAEDKQNGLALLRVHGPELKPVALASASAQPTEITVVGIPDPQTQSGGSAISNTKARLGDALSIEPPLAAGMAGAAVLSPQAFVSSEAKLLGIVTLKDLLALSAQQATLVPAEKVRSFLQANNVTPDATGVIGPEAAKASVVRVICVRK